MTQIAHSSVLNKSCKRTVFGLLQLHNKIFQFLKNKSEDGLLVLVIKAKVIEETTNLTQRTSMDSQRRMISLILTSCKFCLQPCVIYFSKTLHNIFKSQLCMNILTSALTFCKAKYCFQTCNLVACSVSDNQANSTSSADHRPFHFFHGPCILYELSTPMLIWQNFFEYFKKNYLMNQNKMGDRKNRVMVSNLFV